MAIEGPLRELGIHDVFQLLDLSRKTGVLTVTSALRDNRGVVHFDRGAVVHAGIRSNPHRLGELLLRAGKISEGDLARATATQESRADARRLGDILVEMGAVTGREMERQIRSQVEEVVFEMMSWHEGFFTFEERSAGEAPAEATIRISTVALMMEGARRIDEWAHIERRVPHLGVVPALAPPDDAHDTLLDLRPTEWEVLAEIDGVRDLRTIAGALARSDFDVAKIVYGLLSTGVIDLAEPEREEGSATVAAENCGAASIDPAATALAREQGYHAARRGDLREAIESWRRYLTLAPAAQDAPHVRSCTDAAARLHVLIGEASDD